MKVTSISKCQPRPQTLQNINFRGYWRSSVVGAPYPYEGTTAFVSIYVPNKTETIPEIEENFRQKSGSNDIFRPHLIYTLGGENCFVDGSSNFEMIKHRLTISADKRMEEHNYVQAVRDKLEIAKILKEQRQEHDKFLTEEGIRQIYSLADEDSKSTIHDLVSLYNKDMANDLD